MKTLQIAEKTTFNHDMLKGITITLSKKDAETFYVGKSINIYHPDWGQREDGRKSKYFLGRLSRKTAINTSGLKQIWVVYSLHKKV